MYDVKACYEHLNLSAGHLSYEPFCCGFTICTELFTEAAGDLVRAPGEVAPGVGVVVSTPDGERTYWVLGEWDNDIEKRILSSKAQLAVNMLGKKPGDKFDLPSADGTVSTGTVKEIIPLAGEIREWMALPAGMQI